MATTFKTIEILQVPFINTTQRHFLKAVETRVSQRENIFVVTANPEIVMYAQTDCHYLSLLQNADYVTPDGIGIIKGADILGKTLPERITGYDVLVDLLKWGNDAHKSAYFVGAKQEVIDALTPIIAHDYPNLTVKGMRNGYFNDFAPIAADIAETQPDMVFLAVGFPKQEQLIADYRHQNNGLWMGVGGSFDVLSGMTKRAPEFFINHHIEWLYRLLSEPTRFKRMLALPRYLRAVRRQKRDELD
ncbi:acetylglucosaminyldiphospho-UDP acetyl-beta-D-mannosaminyltransferase [Secundilactobacillus paracollinoides]|uniref:WecB/TagA/CpsF family glycosyltransferase n=1 Tax=Secundilactobacillus paracollinoides TaxID=240427 RepID=UPI00081A41D4|nr:WecB/TagA/CpsF family glycosyltransferase [Secundilactobacillus paracollinoides]ANZ63086.1 acetylglucosaminyldiphospho-UDP acetyl-beta-D-mannosaminyltransferase [Secundilactobacillus paracollinoides]